MPERETARPFVRQYYRLFLGGTLMPVVVITIAAPDTSRRQVTTECLLDSGSDHSIFTFEIAELLGLRAEDGLPGSGVGFGGQFGFMSFPHTKFVGSISDLDTKFSFEMSPRFHSPGSDAPQVLGRLDFFRAFERVSINERGKYVDFYPPARRRQPV